MARIHEHTVNIAAPLTLVSAIPLAMQGDAEADALRLHVVNGKESADMKGYAVGGYLERADGIRVMLKGSVTADVVEVKLQEACYRVPGAYKAFVRMTKTTGEKMTLFLFAGRIEGEGDGEIVDEEDTLPSVEELIAMIEEIDQAIAEANEARDGANAAATGADVAAAKALKAAENAGKAEKAANDAAYGANAAADAADEAAVGASAWAKATMEAESLPEGSAPTISVEKNENGGNVIRVGIPTGKTGQTGETGATPQITFEVETGAAGTDVKVEQSGTAEEPHIKLTIPRGDTGAVEGVDYYEGEPAPLGTASPGTSNGLARGNHVHQMPTAEQVGARPNTWTPTAEEVGALPSDGTAVNANALNGKDADEYALKTDLPKAGDWDGNTVPKDIPDGISYVEAGVLTNGHGFPVGYCTVLSVKDNVTRLFQILVEKENGRMKIRSAKDGTTWGEWQSYLRNTDTAADSDKLGGKEPKYYTQPRNLLDNSDFRNPVNQRGATNGNYSREYIIDRWMVAPHAEGTVYVDIVDVDGAIGFSCGSEKYYVFQRLPKTALKTDTAYTLAYKVQNGSIVTAPYHLDDRGEYYQVTLGFDAVVYLEWAALYEGEYTADNLPPYVPKGYGVELTECMRYFRKFGNQSSNATEHIGMAMAANTTLANAVLELGIALRTARPSISYTGTVYLRLGTTDNAISGLSTNYQTGGQMYFAIQSSNLTAGAVYALRLYGGACIDISADL